MILNNLTEKKINTDGRYGEKLSNVEVEVDTDGDQHCQDRLKM